MIVLMLFQIYSSKDSQNSKLSGLNILKENKKGNEI